MHAEDDPWAESLRMLEAVPGRWKVGADRFAVRWDPTGAVNPLRRSPRNFSYPEAVEFVRRCLGPPRGGLGSRHVRRRLEQLKQAPEFVALVLEIGGPHGHPVLYVKWVIDRSGPVPVVSFLSFHSTRKIGP